MSEPDYFLTIEKTAMAEYKDRGSKFLAFAYPVQTLEDCKQNLLLLKKEHAKAVHHCFAHRLGWEGTQFRVSDDGEPSGTAGRPILGQIDSKQLTNIQVIVVRYFGGTLLGVPGLIQAYKSATAMALQLIPIVQKPIEVLYELHFDYTLMNDVMMVVKQTGCSIASQEMQLFCLLRIGVPKARLDEVMYKLNDIRGVEISPVIKK
ncbi:MAG: YigZ family protein [Bacteroidota bacterium]|nr:YigZ family protein [Bacteroidota bacterium]